MDLDAVEPSTCHTWSPWSRAGALFQRQTARTTHRHHAHRTRQINRNGGRLKRPHPQVLKISAQSSRTTVRLQDGAIALTLRLGQAGDSQCFDELVHPPRGNPEQIAGGHYGGQRPLGALTAFPAAIGDRKIQCACPGVELAMPVAIAGVGALVTALAIPGTAQCVGLSAHQRVDERREQFAQHVGMGGGGSPGWHSTTLIPSRPRKDLRLDRIHFRPASRPLILRRPVGRQRPPHRITAHARHPGDRLDRHPLRPVQPADLSPILH